MRSLIIGAAILIVSCLVIVITVDRDLMSIFSTESLTNVDEKVNTFAKKTKLIKVLTGKKLDLSLPEGAIEEMQRQNFGQSTDTIKSKDTNELGGASALVKVGGNSDRSSGSQRLRFNAKPIMQFDEEIKENLELKGAKLKGASMDIKLNLE